MIVGIQDEILKIHSVGLLSSLLVDKTTKSNILWATDAYQGQGAGYQRDKEITVEMITGDKSGMIKNRSRKALEQQSERTRRHGEVFTPLWVCKKMNDYIDEVWFGKPDVFTKDGQPTERTLFPRRRKWQHYVDERRLEITCGEAPYLVSRYDAATGEVIPIENRIGILDRKLRVVSENAADEAEWLRWTVRAFQAAYGYEFQGDNLLIARVNLLMTFEENLRKRWKRKPTEKEYKTIANIVAWNLWQMDGLTAAVPYCKAPKEYRQMSLFDWWESEEYQEKAGEQPFCRIYDWRGDRSLKYKEVNTGGRNMKFKFCIGNPPYQEETVGDQKTYAPPIYHKFIDEAYKVADVVELIHPARFLYNAGGTPTLWNEKMLADSHFKVIYHEQNSGNIFANTNINGGIAITYHDMAKDFGAIGVYSVFSELNTIRNKVWSIKQSSFSDIIANRGLYKFSNQAYIDQSDELAKMTDSRIGSSTFERLDLLFTEHKPNDSYEYIKIFGIINGERVYRWFRKDYVREVENMYKYKVFISKADGASGQIGKPVPARIVGKPVVGSPGTGCTETFIVIGNFDSEYEADSCLKYIMSKFARAMLGILKITQDNTAAKWRYVPLQDFTPASDIDWSKPVAEIDRQLYAKYGLDEKEIEFIETHVKEMA